MSEMTPEQIKTRNQRNIDAFRASGGKIPGFGEHATLLLLLSTIGAKSGRPRTNPMMYLPDQDDPDVVYVFASYAGKDRNPDWYHNVVAHPDQLTVEIGTVKHPASAEVVPEPRRTEIYDGLASRVPMFRQHQERTSRKIPVVALRLQR